MASRRSLLLGRTCKRIGHSFPMRAVFESMFPEPTTWGSVQTARLVHQPYGYCRRCGVGKTELERREDRREIERMADDMCDAEVADFQERRVAPMARENLALELAFIPPDFVAQAKAERKRRRR